MTRNGDGYRFRLFGSFAHTFTGSITSAAADVTYIPKPTTVELLLVGGLLLRLMPSVE